MGDAFDLEGLPNDEFHHVLRFLNTEEKMVLRTVSKRLALKVISVTPDLRQWKVKLSSVEKKADPYHYSRPAKIVKKWGSTKDVKAAEIAKMLENAKDQGIMDLPHFKIHLCVEDADEQTVAATKDICKALKENIFGLTIRGSIGIPESLFSTMNLLSVEELQLVVSPELASAVGQMLKRHAATLQKLVISFYGDLSQSDLNLSDGHASKLEFLQLKYASPHLMKQVFKFCSNVTKLSLQYYENVFGDLEAFRLPKLKELGMYPVSYGCDKLIKSNALSLERLQLYGNVQFSLRGTVLPKLTTYIHSGSGNKSEVLRAGSDSLQKIVCVQGSGECLIKLPKLTDFVSRLSNWSVEMIKRNSESLKCIVLSTESYYLPLLQNLQSTGLPSLEKLILQSYDNTRREVLMQRPEVLQLRAHLPHVHFGRHYRVDDCQDKRVENTDFDRKW